MISKKIWQHISTDGIIRLVSAWSLFIFCSGIANLFPRFAIFCCYSSFWSNNTNMATRLKQQLFLYLLKFIVLALCWLETVPNLIFDFQLKTFFLYKLSFSGYQNSKGILTFRCRHLKNKNTWLHSRLVYRSPNFYRTEVLGTVGIYNRHVVGYTRRIK